MKLFQVVQDAPAQPKLGKAIRAWFVGLGALVVLYLVLEFFHNTTELTPVHDWVMTACLAIAGLCGLASGALAMRKSKEMSTSQRVRLTIALWLLGSLVTFLAGSRLAGSVEGLIDFPAGKTTSYSARLLISRSYRTHGKGASQYIQTTPIQSNLEITKDDYDFMLAHRRVGDSTRDPDQISSKGYFCAQVTMQQSGDALRVLHAGNYKLPKGTVIICPSNSAPTGSPR